MVIFSLNKDYSVVPINWLVETDNETLHNSTIKYCYWPPFKVTSTELINAMDPDPSWQKYMIRVVGGNKIYGMKNIILL